MLQIERWDGDHFGVELRESGRETIEIRGVWQQGEIEVAAKFRCAVQHAGPAAHQQVGIAMRTRLVRWSWSLSLVLCLGLMCLPEKSAGVG